jgi:hypothetical protein
MVNGKHLSLFFPGKSRFMFLALRQSDDFVILDEEILTGIVDRSTVNPADLQSTSELFVVVVDAPEK